MRIFSENALDEKEIIQEIPTYYFKGFFKAFNGKIFWIRININ